MADEADGDGRVQRLEAELRTAHERASELARSNSELSTLLEAAQADAALRASERRSGEAHRLAGIGVWEWDLDTDETWWSPVVYELWGIAPAEAPPSAASRNVHPDDRAAYEAELEAARKTGELSVEWRVVMPDGAVRWLCQTGRLEPSAGGRRILGVTQDVTARRQVETRLRMLLGELQHRVRNVLGVVRSVVRRSVHSATSIDDLAAHLDGRLSTLARTQAILTRTGEAAVDLEEIVRDELMAAAARSDQLIVEGPEIRMRGDTAQTFALAIHELTTNAVKYGALAEPHGHLSVVWEVTGVDGGQRLSLEWKESGVRALDIRPQHAGFGRELLEKGLPFELGATTSLQFQRGGLRAVIEMPLTQNAEVVEEVAEDESEA